jgi:hypothetical protein
MGKEHEHEATYQDGKVLQQVILGISLLVFEGKGAR